MSQQQQPPPQPAPDTAPQTLYVDLMSQPSRACAIVCELSGLSSSSSSSSTSGQTSGATATAPVAVTTIRLDRGDQRSPSYRQLNPLQKVPFLALQKEGGGIPESGAIISYLAAAYPDRVPASFRRPESSCHVAAARHDAALLWLQGSLRAGATRCVFHRVIGPLVFKQKGSKEIAEHGAQVLKAAISDLEAAWLENGRRRFIGHDDSAPGTADVLALCELDQLTLLDAADPEGGPVSRDFVPPGSVVEAWRDRVRAALGGEGGGAYGRATSKLRAAAARFDAERRRRAGDGGGGGGGFVGAGGGSKL